MKDRLLLPAEISFFTLETQQAISATSSAAYKLVEPHINAQLISFLLTLVTSFYYLDLCNLVSTLFLNFCRDFFANRRDRSCCFSGKGQLSRRHEFFFSVQGQAPIFLLRRRLGFEPKFGIGICDTKQIRFMIRYRYQ